MDDEDSSRCQKLVQDHYCELEAKLNGVQSFIHKMISNKLIAASSKENNFDAIMSEFQTKLQTSRSVTDTFYTFINKVLRELGKDDMANKLMIEWSASPTDATSYLTEEREVEEMIPQRDINMPQDKDHPIQTSSARPSSSWEAKRNIQVTTSQQKLAESSLIIQAGVHQQDAEKIPGDEITNPVLHLKNDLQNTLMKPTTVKEKHQLSLDEMISIILYESIPCNLFFISFFDLHSSRKSTLIRDCLEMVTSTPKYTCNERGLSIYNATLLKQWPNNEYLWFAPTKTLKEAVSCGSAILRMSFHYGCELQELSDDAPNDVFKDQILDSHLNFVCSNLKEIVRYSHDFQQISAAVHINIIDNDTRKGAREFLSLISHHLSNNLHITWLTMNDVKESKTKQKRFRHTLGVDLESKIQSTIHYAAEIHSQSPVIFIIMCSISDTTSERDEAKETLLKAIKNEIKRLSLHQLQQPTILVLDQFSSDDMKKLNHELEKIVNAQCLAKKYIKLSWLFLHSAVSALKDVVISYSKLKDIAEKIGIKDREYDEFLQTFTKFMSILHLPAFKPLQDVVILHPVEFINKLSTLFKMPKDFNGIYNMEQLNKKIPDKELADAIVNALCSLGLALKTTGDKVDKRTSALKDPDTHLVFIPLARSGPIIERSYTTSLFIVLDTKVSLPDCQSFFVSQLLALKGSSLLTGEVYQPNIFKILVQTPHHDYIVAFIFQGTYIEVVMEDYSVRGDVFGKILQSCKEALVRMSSVQTYKLALECLGPAQVSTAEYIDPAKREFEFFNPNIKLCHHCEASTSPLRKKWKEVVQKMHENEEKEKDKIKIEKLLNLAHDLGHVIKSNQSLKTLATQLGIRVEREFLTVLLQSCSPWQRVFMIFLLWEKKEEPTKEKLKSALTRLGYSTNILD